MILFNIYIKILKKIYFYKNSGISAKQIIFTYIVKNNIEVIFTENNIDYSDY